LGWKSNVGGGAPSAEFAVAGLVLADGCVGMREVRDAGLLGTEFLFDLGEFGLLPGDGAFKGGGFFDQGGALGIGSLGDSLAEFLSAVPEAVHFLNEVGAPVGEAKDLVNVGLHVAVGGVSANLVGARAYGFEVKHERPLG
jgi:hypothetical protein